MNLKGHEMVRYVFLLLILTLSAEVGSSQSPSSPKNSEPDRLKPVINVQQPPDAPLKLTVTTRWATPDAQSLEIFVVAENTSDFEIRTYVWCIDKKEGSRNDENCLLFSVDTGSKIIRPGESDGKSTWRRIPLDNPPISIEIALDFVQFTNGNFWGSETSELAERLRGFRAGTLAVKEKFAKTQNETGLLEILKLDALNIEAPEGHSSAWRDGFRDGVSTFFERLQKANKEGGLPEVIRVLQMTSK